MMAGEYRAVRRILHNGVGAYNPGDLVDARAVEPDGWVSLADVEPVNPPPAPPPLPARNATQEQWAAYAVSQGMDEAEAADASRADLIAAYGGE